MSYMAEPDNTHLLKMSEPDFRRIMELYGVGLLSRKAAGRLLQIDPEDIEPERP